ncbi:MAG: hypothetical protein K1X63_16615 [Chitinophagales bacterium]|nr:hypothetical protein [Chitinophagales bacterium]
MDQEIIQSILPILSNETIIYVHRLVGSEPVSFASLRQEIVRQIIDRGLEENLPDAEIARQAGVCRRTVLRHKKSKLIRYKNQPRSLL